MLMVVVVSVGLVSDFFYLSVCVLDFKYTIPKVLFLNLPAWNESNFQNVAFTFNNFLNISVCIHFTI